MYPPKRGESNTPDGAISLHNYGSTKNKNIDGGGDHQNEPLIHSTTPITSTINTQYIYISQGCSEQGSIFR